MVCMEVAVHFASRNKCDANYRRNNNNELKDVNQPLTANEKTCMNASEQKTEFVPKTGPIVGCVLVVAGWLLFILSYALYWSKGYDLFQNVIVTIVSIGIAGLLMGGVMMIWYRVSGELRRQNNNKQE